ncbi:MAG: toxic anion resistance protein [Eubacteriales bacterium]|nr:toxic anion resistance protein [Eubacteriales bacterium]
MSDEFTKTAGEVPTLTLEPFAEEKKTAETQIEAGMAQMPSGAAENLQTETKPDVVDDSVFTEEEKKQIEEFAEKINVQDSNVILQYGAAAQQKLADFSQKALDNVRTQDLGEVGDMLAGVVTQLKDFDAEEDKKGIFGFFKKHEQKIETLKAKYDKTEANVDKICDALEEHQVRLLKDTAVLEEMYKLNTGYFKELSMYIAAGRRKLEKVRSTELAELTEKAKTSNLPEDAQAAKDLSDYCDRFEKKLHDLELSRMVSLQTAPQLRLIQNNNTLMVEKIQSTLVNTIPLWKNQMVIALGLAHASEAARAQNAVSEMTNELLKKNAEALHTATVNTARESERGIVDIETLKQTNEQLVQTLDEVLQIQSEGRQKRQAAEEEMVKMEGELKQKLLEIRK